MKTKYLLAALVVAVAALTGVVSAQLVGPGTAGSARGQAAPAAATTTSRPDGERAAKRTARPDPADQKLSQADLIAKVKPSVVHPAGSNGSGSGVIIDARRGLVLTNAHLTFGQQGMRARVGDDPGTETAARLVAAAPCDDLAVVRLVDTPANQRAIRLGDSSTLRQGDHVTILGYPVSFEEQAEASILDQQVVAGEGSVSVADVVAAPDPGLPRYVSTIQHQAPVNHGNSGGPLVDDRGSWWASTRSATTRPRGSSTRSASSGCASCCPAWWPAGAGPTWDGT